MAKKKYIKNHVVPRTRAIQKKLKPTFGLSVNLLVRALHNEPDALKKLADMGKEGAIISEFAPEVKQRALEAIKGTEDLNTTLNAVMQAAGKSTIAINKALHDSELSNDSFVSEAELEDIRFSKAKKLGEIKAQKNKSYVLMKAWVDRHTTKVDADYRLLQQELSTEVKQNSIDEKHEIDMGHYYLQEGSDAREDLKPKKQYAGMSIIQRVKEFLLA